MKPVIASPAMQKIILFLLLSAVSIACRKQFDENKNFTMRLSGQVVDSSTNKGIANVPVKAVWQIPGSAICILCADTVAATTTTDAGGYFDFTAAIDTTLFYRDYLAVHAAPGNSYLSFYHDQNILTPSAAVAGIRLTFFPKTMLTIQSVNSGTDSLTALDLSYAFTSGYFGLNEGLEAFPKTPVTVETAAGIYTQLRWRKVYGFGNTKDFTDSIKCLPGEANVYTLHY